MGLIQLLRATTQASSDDWATRASSAWVVVANRLNNATTLSNWEADDGTTNHISLDTSIHPPGSTGSCRFEVLNSDTTASGQLSVPYGTTYAEGDTYWHSYRIYCQAQESYARFPGASQGPKYSIASRDGNGAAPTGSNQDNEVVVQAMQAGGRLSIYARVDVTTTVELVETYDTSGLTGGTNLDVTSQPDFDTGVANPLTGNNPYTGAAWSDYDQYVAQIGAMHYGRRSTPGVDFYAEGLGDPYDAAFRAYPGEWITITVCIQMGTWNVADTRVILMAARDGQPYQLLADDSTVTLGDDVPHNGLNLLPYRSDGTSGGRQVTSRGGELETAFEIWNVSPTCPTGNATLSYNATTGLFTFQANGDTVGNAYGHSEANGFLDINIISNNTAYYINGRVTVANLPGSGTTNETVTIGTNRPDTFRNYADVIISTAPIESADLFPVVAGTELAEAAASLGADSWVQISPTGQDATLEDSDGQGSGTIIGFMNKAAWNPIRRSIEAVSADHNGTWRHWEYRDHDSTFNRLAANAVPSGLGHGYDHNAINPYTGDRYYVYMGAVSAGADLNVYSKAIGAADSAAYVLDFAISDLDRPQFTSGADWWSGTFTGGTGVGAEGGLLIYNDGAEGGYLRMYDPVSDSIVYGNDTAGGNGDDIHVVLAYSEVHNVAVFGGGNNAGATVYRLNSDSTVTAMPAAPFGVGSGENQNRFWCDPVTGNFLALSQTADLYELDPTGSGSWTQLGDPPVAMDSANHRIVCPIPLYGVSAIIIQENTTGGTMWVYKRQ